MISRRRIKNAFLAVGAILLLLSFIGFAPFLHEELYWYQVDEYRWEVLTRTVTRYDLSITGLIISIIGAFFLLASIGIGMSMEGATE